MSQVIATLHRDHVNLSRLLNVLEHQLTVFDEAGRPDYDVLEGLVEYFADYPDLHHHPLENAVFRKLRERDPAAAEDVGDQEAEHQILASLSEKFGEAVRNVVMEAEIPRENFDRIAQELLTFYRHHIKQEEVVFFPAAERALTPQDWVEIEQASPGREDPVFGEKTGEHFETLRRHVMAWDRENQQA